ncbi:hypothetical protein KKB83_05685 [Patescibacteria group bacterium]|nr:hypothetical protein [Patescibacteria group bacterium]
MAVIKPISTGEQPTGEQIWFDEKDARTGEFRPPGAKGVRPGKAVTRVTDYHGGRANFRGTRERGTPSGISRAWEKPGREEPSLMKQYYGGVFDSGVIKPGEARYRAYLSSLDQENVVGITTTRLLELEEARMSQVLEPINMGSQGRQRPTLTEAKARREKSQAAKQRHFGQKT